MKLCQNDVLKSMKITLTTFQHSSFLLVSKLETLKYLRESYFFIQTLSKDVNEQKNPVHCF